MYICIENHFNAGLMPYFQGYELTKITWIINLEVRIDIYLPIFLLIRISVQLFRYINQFNNPL